MITHYINIATGRSEVFEQSPFLTWLLANHHASYIEPARDQRFVLVRGITQAEAKRLVRRFVELNEIDSLQSRMRSNRYDISARQRMCARYLNLHNKYALSLRILTS